MDWILVGLILGVILLCAEVYVPGGILGAIGIVLLVASLIGVFARYGATVGGYYLAGVAAVVAAGMYLMSRYVPHSRFARSMFLRTEQRGYHSTSEDLSPLLGKEGVALTLLRPSGKALIDGRRIDVVTEGALVEKGAPVRVMEVEGARVVVRQIGV